MFVVACCALTVASCLFVGRFVCCVVCCCLFFGVRRGVLFAVWFALVVVCCVLHAVVVDCALLVVGWL